MHYVVKCFSVVVDKVLLLNVTLNVSALQLCPIGSSFLRAKNKYLLTVSSYQIFEKYVKSWIAIAAPFRGKFS